MNSAYDFIDFCLWGLDWNIPTVQIMPRRQPVDKPLSEPGWLAYCRIYASLGLNGLNVYDRRFKILQGLKVTHLAGEYINP